MTNTHTRAQAWLKPRQVRDLRTAAQSDEFLPYLRDRNEAIVAMLYDTGLRVGELVQIDVDFLHLDDDPAYLAIPAHIQKDYPTDRSPSYEEMNLAVDDSTYDTVSRLRSYLNNRWRYSEALFPSRQADRMTTESVRRVVRSLAVEADVRPQSIEGGAGDPEDVTPHTLRHSVAYRMLHKEDGYTLYDVRNRLRHATIKTTEDRYDHFDRI
ncbi:tyrosine-type recombinase/integrase [Halostella litorea]|uniref:tyrosine-type recombinase/integrase n=1 Tax=Halostella litorea TaxID=2528831 RepID=UPI0010932534|nr:site-specific integrase [Halostella litorea]